MDRDGRDDLIFVTYRGARPAGATIVFGRRPPASLDASRSGPHGFRLVARRSELHRVTTAGDLNGDGRADLLAHTSRGAPPSVTNRLHVVLGRRRAGTLELDAAALPAIVALGRWPSDVAAAGDVNGDGVGDAIVSRIDRRFAYTVCVVLGRRGAWPKTTSCGGKGTLVLGGAGPRSGFGSGVQAVGDLNGDRVDDVLVSALGEVQPGTEFGGGALYVVYGRRGTDDIDVTRDDGVVRIAAGRDLRESFRTFAAPGDVSGDGRPDLAVGGDLFGNGWLVSFPPP